MLVHLVLGLALQAIVGLLGRGWWTGALVATTYFMSREIAQAEYRWIERYGDRRRANMPWWGPFDPRVWWCADAWLDWIVPCAATVLVAWLLN